MTAAVRRKEYSSDEAKNAVSDGLRAIGAARAARAGSWSAARRFVDLAGEESDAAGHELLLGHLGVFGTQAAIDGPPAAQLA